MKNFIIIVIAILILAISAFVILNKSQNKPKILPTANLTPTPIIQSEKINITATFTIITGNITRSFKSEKYHNLSPDVYIENPDPTIVHVTKVGITWDDFFKTLPMKLTKDCLITGDGETLCSEKEGGLKFYLNEAETPDLLEKEIKDGDKALIKFI